MKLTALTVVILVLGIVLWLAMRDAVFQAEAAKPPPPEPQPEPELQPQAQPEEGHAVRVRNLPRVLAHVFGLLAVAAGLFFLVGVLTLLAFTGLDWTTRDGVIVTASGGGCLLFLVLMTVFRLAATARSVDSRPARRSIAAADGGAGASPA